MTQLLKPAAEPVVEPVAKAPVNPASVSKAVATSSEPSKAPVRKKRLRQITLFETAAKKPRTRSSHAIHDSLPEPILIEESNIAYLPTTGQHEASEATDSSRSTTESTSEAHENSNQEPIIDTVETEPVVSANDDSELRIDPRYFKDRSGGDSSHQGGYKTSH